jgi:hypothetical protein
VALQSKPSPSGSGAIPQVTSTHLGGIDMPTLEAELRRLLRIVADDELCDDQSALVEIVNEMRHVAAEDRLDFESAVGGPSASDLTASRA